MGEGDAAHLAQHHGRIRQPGFHVLGQVDLRRIPGHHRACAEPDAGQEHLHLLGGRVLCLVENDEGMIERAAPHEGERRDFDGMAFDQAGDLVESHQIVKRVIQRAQIGIDLLRQVARQEAEPFAGFDRRPRQHQALDLLALQRIDRARHGEIGFAGAGRTDAEGDVVTADLLDVLALTRGARAQIGAAGAQCRAFLVEAAARQFDQPELDIVERKFIVRAVIEMFDRLRALLGLRRIAAKSETRSTAADGDIERRFDLSQVLVQRAAQIGQPPVVFRRQAQFNDIGFQMVSFLVIATSPRRLCG